MLWRLNQVGAFFPLPTRSTKILNRGQEMPKMVILATWDSVAVSKCFWGNFEKSIQWSQSGVYSLRNVCHHIHPLHHFWGAGGRILSIFQNCLKKKIIQLTKVAAVILLFPTFYLILRCCLCNVISQHIVGKEAAVNGTLLIELFWSSRGWEICLSFLYLECQSLDNQYIFSVSPNSC